MTLSEYMKSRQLDEAAVAALVGCSPGAVKKWRYRERIPRKDQLQRITEVTDGQVTANDFFASPSSEAAA